MASARHRNPSWNQVSRQPEFQLSRPSAVPGGWARPGLIVTLAVVSLGLITANRENRSAVDDSAASQDSSPVPSNTNGEATASTEPIWRTDLDEARKLAAERKRPILLRFTADWCPPCQVMNRSVFPDPKVKAALSERAIPVILDIDEERNAELAYHYKVRGIPSLLLIDAEGKVLDRGGFMSAEALLRFLGGS